MKLTHAVFLWLALATRAGLAVALPAAAPEVADAESRASMRTDASTQALADMPPLPQRLSDTGLFVDGSATRIRADVHAFSPQYPLWSDGARKRRWFALPAGSAIDASDPDAWKFPRGTRLWKEFSFGRRVETRYIERLADGAWRYASYLWNEDGSDAVLAPEFGVSLSLPDAPTGVYVVPSRGDCLACHEGAPSPVLGLGALQLSPARDPQALHAEPVRADDVDLQRLVDLGLLVHLPPSLLAQPPRIAARSASERAALGYLHGNCAHCHHRGGTDDGAAVPVDLSLAQRVGDRDSIARVLRSMLATPARFRAPSLPADQRLVVPGDAASSVLPLRMQSRNPMRQMPPLGTRIPDREALALIGRWIDHDLQPLEESHR